MVDGGSINSHHRSPKRMMMMMGVDAFLQTRFSMHSKPKIVFSYTVASISPKKYAPPFSRHRRRRSYQSHQLSSILKDERGARLGDRVATLESKLEAAASRRGRSGSAVEASSEQKRKFLRRLLRHAVLLRDTLVIEGVGIGEPGIATGTEACWVEGEEEDEGAEGAVDDQADEDLIRRARGRCV